jgi:hypothetical protein
MKNFECVVIQRKVMSDKIVQSKPAECMDRTAIGKIIIIDYTPVYKQ